MVLQKPASKWLHEPANWQVGSPKEASFRLEDMTLAEERMKGTPKSREGDCATTGRITPTQRAYLDYVQKYLELHRKAPSEADMVDFFRVSPPAVHRMVVALEEKGAISRVPGQARSIRIVEPQSGGKTKSPPRKPANFISEPLDPEITPLVMALRADPVVVTKGSCWGHRRKPAYIDLAVEGLDGLRHFVERLNMIDRKVRSESLFVVQLNWGDELITACAFDIFPNWIMLNWTIEGTGKKRSPSAALLATIAKLYVGR
jgi:repressor LexA